jgi:hypothetical protein
MKLTNWIAVAASALVFVACDSSGTTAPDASLDAQFDQVDPIVTIFTASYGLPDGPFAGANFMPFMGPLTLPGGASVQRPSNFGSSAGVGAPLPDSLKLSATQKIQIQSLVTAFHAANKVDIDAMMAAHVAAHQAGKSKEEVKAILDAAKPAANRVKTAGEALRIAVQNVLTPAQRSWMDAHRPTKPFHMP